ncbi:MAG: hypothetical protein AAF514_17420 [Verrucomicrobiota bacterium]
MKTTFYLATGVILLVAGLSHYRETQAKKSLTELFRAIEERKAARDWPGLLEVSVTILESDPDNIAALRPCLKAGLFTKSVYAYGMAKKLAEHPDAISSDWQMAIEACLLNKKLYESGQLLSKARERFPDEQRFVILQALWETFQGNNSQALGLLTSIDSEAAEKPEFQLLLAELNLRIAGREFEGQKALISMVQDQVMPEKAISLLSQCRIDSTLLPTLSLGTYISNPESPTTNLAARRIDLQKTPNQRQTIIGEAIESFSDSAPEQLCQWLTTIGEPGRSLQLISSLPDEKRVKLRSQELRASLDAGKYLRAQELLDEPLNGLTPLQNLTFKAFTASMLDRKSLSRALWDRAMNKAAREPSGEGYLSLSDLAHRLGRPDLALDALARACRLPVSASITTRQYMALMGFFGRNRDFDSMAYVARILRTREPGNPDFINNGCYLNLLQDTAIEEAVSSLETLVTAHPHHLSYQCSLALGYLAQDRPAEAEKLLKPSEDVLTRPDSHPSNLLVYGATLRAAGKSERAAKIFQQIDPTGLLPAEQELLRTDLSSG